ncbi:MAG: type II toxin-antitoxin system prevent-host-death family antitoxin [Planctomycetia bacterium]|jgi:prevent-host-death family protein
MHTVTSREARAILSDLLNEVEHGSIISITRRGKEVARLVPPETVQNTSFPDLTEFRDSIQVKGKPTSQVVMEARDEERF